MDFILPRTDYWADFCCRRSKVSILQAFMINAVNAKNENALKERKKGRVKTEEDVLSSLPVAFVLHV